MRLFIRAQQPYCLPSGRERQQVMAEQINTGGDKQLQTTSQLRDGLALLMKLMWDEAKYFVDIYMKRQDCNQKNRCGMTVICYRQEGNMHQPIIAYHMIGLLPFLWRILKQDIQPLAFLPYVYKGWGEKNHRNLIQIWLIILKKNDNT